MNSMQLAPVKLEQLLRDEATSVRRVALQVWRRQVESSSPDELCSFLWSLGELEEFDATAIVTATLDHAHPMVRSMARLALMGLHPLLGIPARLGETEPSPQSATRMLGWLVPREVFERTLVDMLGDSCTHVDMLVESLSACDGEQPRVCAILRETKRLGLLNGYQSAQQNRKSGRSLPQLIVSLTRRCSRNCDCCYISETDRRQGHELDWNRLVDALDCAQSIGAARVSFTGGEPTEYSRFSDLIREIQQRGMRTYLNTHGLLSDEVIAALQNPAVTRVGIHVDSQQSYGEVELDRLRSCARKLMDVGVDVFIRFTERDPDHVDARWLVELACRMSIRYINFAYAFPNVSRSNRYMSLSQLAAAKTGLLSLLSFAREQGIRVRLAKPLPLCLFTRTEYAQLHRQHDLSATCTIHEERGIHNMVMDLNGRISPCVGLPMSGPMFERRNLESIRKHCKIQTTNALARLQSDCQGCALLAIGVCQRACLAHGLGGSDGLREMALS